VGLGFDNFVTGGYNGYACNGASDDVVVDLSAASYAQSVMNLYDFMRQEQGLHDWRPIQTPRY